MASGGYSYGRVHEQNSHTNNRQQQQQHGRQQSAYQHPEYMSGTGTRQNYLTSGTFESARVNNDPHVSTYQRGFNSSHSPAPNASQQQQQHQRHSVMNPSSSNFVGNLSQYRYSDPPQSTYNSSNRNTQSNWPQSNSQLSTRHQEHYEPQHRSQNSYYPLDASVTSGTVNDNNVSRMSYSYNQDYGMSNSIFRNSPDTASTMTVNPEVVYDASHEYRRQAAAAEAARKAEEERRRIEEEERHRLEAEEEQRRRLEEERKAKEAQQRERDAQASRNQNSLPNTKSKKKSSSSGKSKAAPSSDHMQAAAAMTMLQCTDESTSKADLELKMRELFKKMREFNQQDPELLSRLWTEERDDYVKAISHSDPQPSEPPQTSSTPPKPNSGAPRKKQTKQRQANNQQEKAAQNPPNTQPAAKSAPTPSTGSKTSPASHELPAPIPPSMNMGPKTGGLGPSDNVTAIASTISDLLSKKFNGKTLPVLEITRILGANPSYLEFCQILQAQGFQLDINQFARDIVILVPTFRARSQNLNKSSHANLNSSTVEQTGFTAVNDVNKSSGNAKGKSSRKASQTASQKTSTPGQAVFATSSSIDPSLEGLDAVKQFVERTPNMQPEASISSPIQPSKTSRDRKTAKAISVQSTTPMPPTKHDLARKKNFGDLVDLTQLRDSDDDEVMSPSNANTVNASIPTQPSAPPTASAMGEDIPMTGHTTNQPNGNTGTNSQPISTSSAQASGFSVFASTQRAPPVPVYTEVMVLPLNKYKAIRRSSYDPRTIARDVLLACGRHPHMRHLNAHFEPLKGKFSGLDNNADLSSFRWDLADPGGAAVGSGPRSTELASSVMPDALDADDEISDDENTMTGPPTSTLQAVAVNGDGVVSQTQTRGSSLIKHKFRGFRSHTQPRKDSETPRPSESARQTSENLSYRELREQQEAEARSRGEPVVRRRGRPVGWRKHMTKSPGSYKITSARTKAEKPPPEPVYEVYKCEWTGCGAELHNLATLRRHLFKIHGKADAATGRFVCRWHQCGKIQTITDAATNRTTSKFAVEDFATLEQWKEHMEKTHLSPIAWRLGDGPKGGLSDNYESEVSESYNSDSQGKRVTPKVVILSEPSSASRPEPASKGLSELQREAEMEKLAERNRKRDIGPAMDRQGATLATAERRQGFIDNQNAMEIVDEED